MNIHTRILHYWLIEPFTWIIFAIFQPARFHREFRLEGSWLERQLLPLLRLAIPLFLIIYPTVLLVDAFLLPFNLLLHTDLLSFFLDPVLSIMLGIVLGMAVGIMSGMVSGIVSGMAVGIVSGMAVGIVLGIVVGIVSGIVLGIVSGIVLGIAVGIVLNIRLGIVLGIVLVIAVNITDVGLGVVFGTFYFIGFYRLPFYLISGGSVLISYMYSRSNPPQALRYLQRSALHWDELVYLPLPYLKTMLLIIYDEEPAPALDEIRYIATERPLQLRAAQAAALEIVMRDLEQRTSIWQIAEAAQRIDILLQDTALMDPIWVRSLVLLADASQDALQSTTSIGLKSRVKAIEKMMNNLRKISANVAFRNQRLNRRLRPVIEAWMLTAGQESERLRGVAQEVGLIDNPYKPAQVLHPHDSLFVGRRDLAGRLENELAKGSRRSTLLINGERRMGKSSTLLHLPYLLGSSYISIFYNLQDPGIYASTSTFLGTVARGIYTQFLARGLPIKALSFSEVYESTQRSNDMVAYSLFGNWLKSVELLLEQEEKTLLLAFDEFEKLEEVGQRGYLNLSLLLDWFRSIVQFHPRIALLFSGVHTLDEMGKNTVMNWSSYLINVQILKVTFLKEQEARQLISKPVPDYPGEEIFGPGVVDKIMYETGCHPFLIQAICSALIENLNVEKREQAQLADVDVASERILESWVGYFSDLWTRTDENQRACLIALNALHEANVEAIQRECGLDITTVRRTLQILRKRDLVSSDGVDNYSITVPIFSRWVENSKDL